MGRFCVAWSNHNWIRRDPARDIDRVCSICGTVEPRRLNRAEARPRKAGRQAPAVAIDRDEPMPPCPKGDAHEVREGRGYDYCALCGVVIRWPVRTKAPRPVVVAAAPSDKAVRRRRGKVLMLFARDGSGCFYCGAALTVEEAVLDHFIPASKGGPDELENRRASCIGCDKRKRDRMPWDFLPKRFGHLRLEEEATMQPAS